MQFSKNVIAVQIRCCSTLFIFEMMNDLWRPSDRGRRWWPFLEMLTNMRLNVVLVGRLHIFWFTREHEHQAGTFDWVNKTFRIPQITRMLFILSSFLANSTFTAHSHTHRSRTSLQAPACATNWRFNFRSPVWLCTKIKVYITTC